jgi:enoyl-[acyl-carrier-protein] reductase (NADH)
LDLQAQGNSYISQEVQGQVALLRQLKDQMHEVASAQSGLIQDFDASSQQNQLLNMQISSEMATVARNQEQFQSNLDIIHHAIASIDTNVKKDLDQIIKNAATRIRVMYETLCRECLRSLFVTDP